MVLVMICFHILSLSHVVNECGSMSNSIGWVCGSLSSGLCREVYGEHVFIPWQPSTMSLSLARVRKIAWHDSCHRMSEQDSLIVVGHVSKIIPTPWHWCQIRGYPNYYKKYTLFFHAILCGLDKAYLVLSIVRMLEAGVKVKWDNFDIFRWQRSSYPNHKYLLWCHEDIYFQPSFRYCFFSLH